MAVGDLDRRDPRARRSDHADDHQRHVRPVRRGRRDDGDGVRHRRRLPGHASAAQPHRLADDRHRRVVRGRRGGGRVPHVHAQDRCRGSAVAGGGRMAQQLRLLRGLHPAAGDPAPLPHGDPVVVPMAHRAHRGPDERRPPDRVGDPEAGSLHRLPHDRPTPPGRGLPIDHRCVRLDRRASAHPRGHRLRGCRGGPLPPCRRRRTSADRTPGMGGCDRDRDPDPRADAAVRLPPW